MIRSVLTGLVTLHFCICVAHAEVIYNNFGPNDSYSRMYGLAIFSHPDLGQVYDHAQGIIVPSGQDYTLTRLELALDSDDPHRQQDEGISISITEDVQGLPAASPLETFTIFARGSTVIKSIIPFESVTHPLLRGGRKYWIVAEPILPESHFIWKTDLRGHILPSNTVIRHFKGPWEPQTGDGALRITAEPVPEPSSFTLLAFAAFTAACLSFRRSRRP